MEEVVTASGGRGAERTAAPPHAAARCSSAEKPPMAEHLRFVIQRHHARTLHYDFRLEHAGVLKSWALPKGVPTKPGEQRLAIETEDHDLAFGEFEGTIPAGEYGAGTIEIWDRGTYSEEEWSDRAVCVVLHGTVATGRYRLIPFPKGGESAWLIIRARG